jgi:hypothetical protein
LDPTYRDVFWQAWISLGAAVGIASPLLKTFTTLLTFSEKKAI